MLINKQLITTENLKGGVNLMFVDFSECRENLYILEFETGKLHISKILLDVPKEIYKYFDELKKQAKDLEYGIKIHIER